MGIAEGHYRIVAAWMTSVPAEMFGSRSHASLRPDQAMPAELLLLWQAHWRIESLFWMRDAVSGKDHSTTRTGRAHQAFAAFRNLAISLIHLWRGRHITATREHAGYPVVLFRHLQCWRLAITRFKRDRA